MDMKLYVVPCFCAIALAVTSVNATAANSAVDPADLKEAQNSYIFVFQEASVASEHVSDRAAEMAREHAGTVRHTFSHIIKGFSANMPAKAAARLAENPSIAYYEQNGVARASVLPLKAPTRVDNNGVDRTVAQSVPYGIARVGGSRDGSGLHAWVIDTGIDLDNADLNVGVGANFVSRGKNTVDDGNGHGTHVAGTIAALDNAIDVVGVAANATVHPVRVLDRNGSGYIDWIVAGIDFVAANAQAGDAVNMSLGATGHFQSLHDAVVRLADKGVLVSVAAGNSSDNANFYEPAHIEHPNVYTISAIDAQDIFASFSNYANPPIDFAAPGVNVTSTSVGGGVVTYSGTSMAAPHVAGLLLFAVPSTSGTAINDPDGNPDFIAYQ